MAGDATEVPGRPARPDRQASIVALLALAEEMPEVGEVQAFLDDDDPAVRRAALDVLGETLPPGAELALAHALGDPDESVRRAASDGLRELREVIEPTPAFRDALVGHAGSPAASTRAAVVRLLWEHKLGDLATYRAALGDVDVGVRREAIAGLVSLDATGDLACAVSDADPLVRLAVARGLAAIGDPAGVVSLEALSGDADLRVRAAALEGYAVLGCGQASLPAVLTGCDEPAWELRKAAATALRSAPPTTAVPALVRLARDPHMDVRRAAVQALGRWAQLAEVRPVLEEARLDPDADVRGHARLALG